MISASVFSLLFIIISRIASRSPSPFSNAFRASSRDFLQDRFHFHRLFIGESDLLLKPLDLRFSTSFSVPRLRKHSRRDHDSKDNDKEHSVNGHTVSSVMNDDIR
jgi:hypothetical protein